MTLAHLFTAGPFGVDVGPLQHDEIARGGGQGHRGDVFIGGALNLKLLDGETAEVAKPVSG